MDLAGAAQVVVGVNGLRVGYRAEQAGCLGVTLIVGFFGVGLSPTGTTDPYALRRQAIGIMTDGVPGKLVYEMTGRLAGPGPDSVYFESSGEFTLPAEIFGSGK